MNSCKSKLVTIGMISAATVSAFGQEKNGWGRVGVSYRATFNVSASFSGLGGFSPTSNPGPAGRVAGPVGSVLRQYDDGFVGMDISENFGDMTSYWGYNNASQVVGDSIQMHSGSSSPTVSSGRVDDDPHHGLELSYSLPLGGKNKFHWGIDGGLNWTDLNIKDRRTLNGGVSRLTHAFSLGGVVPPVAPYTGTVEGPGALLSDVATVVGSSSTPGGALIVGNRQIEAALYGLRLGPYVEFDLCKRCSFMLGGGLSVGLMDSEFSFNETVSVAGLGTQSRRGFNQDREWLYGGYIRGQLNVILGKGFGLLGAVEWNHLQDFEQSAGGKTARLELGKAIVVSGGLTYSF